MKKYLIVLFLCFNVWAVKRMVVGEYFTSTTQPYTYRDTTFDHIAIDDSAYLAAIRYHANFPSPANDPFWHNNEQDNNEQWNYYYGTGIPQLFIDGQGSYLNWQTQIDQRADKDAPLSVIIFRNYQDSIKQGKIFISITNPSDSTVTGNIHYALTETGIPYKGANNLPVHNQVMLDFFPDTTEEEITFRPGDSVAILRSFSLKDTIWLWNDSHNFGQQPDTFHCVLPESCQIVAFVQNDGNHEIYQGAKVWLLPIPDIAFNSRNIPGDNRLIQGETADLFVTLKNLVITAHSPTVWLRTRDSTVTVLDSVASFQDISSGGSADNSQDPFRVKVSAQGTTPHFVDFDLFVITDEQYFKTLSFTDTIFPPNGLSESLPIILTGVPSLQSSPSPFTSSTSIKFSIPKSNRMALNIYNSAGELIRTLIDNKVLSGAHSVLWDGSDNKGRPATSGAYFIILSSKSFSITRKIVLTW